MSGHFMNGSSNFRNKGYGPHSKVPFCQPKLFKVENNGDTASVYVDCWLILEEEKSCNEEQGVDSKAM